MASDVTRRPLFEIPKNATIYKWSSFGIGIITIALFVFTVVTIAHAAARVDSDMGEVLKNFRKKPLLIIPFAIATLLGAVITRIFYVKSRAILAETKLYSGDIWDKSMRAALNSKLNQNEFFFIGITQHDIEMVWKGQDGKINSRIIARYNGTRGAIDEIRCQEGVHTQLIPSSAAL